MMSVSEGHNRPMHAAGEAEKTLQKRVELRTAL
jgi:hypothetical protein